MTTPLENLDPNMVCRVDPRTLVKSRHQPRTFIQPEKMDELRRSIEAAGGVQIPVIVRPGLNELIDGECRMLIAIELGYESIPVFWRDCTDDEAAELASLANVKREDLNPIDETNMVLDMLVRRLKLTDRPAAIELLKQISNQGKRKKADDGNNVIPAETVAAAEAVVKQFTKGELVLGSFVSNKLKLIDLPTDVIDAVRTNQLDYTKAVKVAKIDDPAARKELIDRVVDEGLSVAAVKEEVDKKNPKPPKKDTPKPKGKKDGEQKSELPDLPLSGEVDPPSLPAERPFTNSERSDVNALDQVAGLVSRINDELKFVEWADAELRNFHADLSQIWEKYLALG